MDGRNGVSDIVLSHPVVSATIISMSSKREQDRGHFELLVVEHHVRLRVFVRSMAVDPDWVDDIAQEAFLIAYREWDSFDQTRDFGKWLRGIAANLIRNEIRKDARRQRILHTGLTDMLLRRSTGSKEMLEPITIEAIKECVDKLESRSKAVVRGRYHDGLAAPQLARQLETTAVNIRQMLVRIRRQIKQCVEYRILEKA